MYPTNLRKNAKYTIHVDDNSQYHMNTLTIIQYPTISNISFSSAIRDLSCVVRMFIYLVIKGKH